MGLILTILFVGFGLLLPWITALTLRLRAMGAEVFVGQMGWQPIVHSMLAYVLAFNITFFIQELFLVLPKSMVPGLTATLYHNDHNWTGDAPIAELFQGTGALAILTSGLAFVVMLAPLGIVLAMSFGANRFSTGTLQALFWAYAVLMGVSLSTIFLVYTGASIAATFFASAGAFAGLSLYGYTTQKDISGWGSFLIMGVIGIIIASVINMFLHSPALYYAIGIIGVLVFAGLTAYDTQRLKEQYRYVAGSQMAGKAVVLGALTLYLDFINMFLFLLRFMGNSRN